MNPNNEELFEKPFLAEHHSAVVSESCRLAMGSCFQELVLAHYVKNFHCLTSSIEVLPDIETKIYLVKGKIN